MIFKAEKISWKEESGGLRSIGLQSVRCNKKHMIFKIQSLFKKDNDE